VAFDGITIHALVNELNNTILNGRIYKIAQPEKDELILTVKKDKMQYRLLISSNASLPLIYLSSVNKPSPLTAPNFCMVLRKHLNNGTIINITQPDMERIINIDILHLNEMGDECTDTLVIELMGKYSNIIFINSEGMIIDSIKHVTLMMSSVREVLPGRDYFIPGSNKLNPLNTDFDAFYNIFSTFNGDITKFIFTNFNGISPLIASEIVSIAGFNPDDDCSNVTGDRIKHFYNIFQNYMSNVSDNIFNPVIYYKDDVPVEYSFTELSSYNGYEKKEFSSPSALIEKYYADKAIATTMKRKTSDLRQLIGNLISKTAKKLDLQEKQIKDTEKKDKYKLYGELITAYSYSIEKGTKNFTCENYYDNNKEITVPLDPTLDPMENANKYFNKYNKLKRTKEALDTISRDTKRELEHLETIMYSLERSTTEQDVDIIKKELQDYNYIKKSSGKKKASSSQKSKPIHIKLNDNFELYIGKNNYQNEEVSFKIADNNDYWFHSKNVPGSHVILKTSLKDEDIPDEIFEIAGGIAAFYSKAGDQQKVEIDYTKKTNLKRVAGAAPGFVIYHTNYSMMCKPINPKEKGYEIL